MEGQNEYLGQMNRGISIRTILTQILINSALHISTKPTMNLDTLRLS